MLCMNVDSLESTMTGEWKIYIDSSSYNLSLLFLVLMVLLGARLSLRIQERMT